MNEKNMPHISEAYRFCPKCKSATLGLEKSETQLSCSCGFEIFFGPVLNVSVIVKNKRDDMMLSWRKREPKSECWEINGGFANPGATAEEAGIRDLRREIGSTIEITKLQYVTSEPMMYPYGGYERPIICVYFVATIISGHPGTSDEVGHVGFFSALEIPWNKIGRGTDERALRHLLQLY